MVPASQKPTRTCARQIFVPRILPRGMKGSKSAVGGPMHNWTLESTFPFSRDSDRPCVDVQRYGARSECIV